MNGFCSLLLHRTILLSLKSGERFPLACRSSPYQPSPYLVWILVRATARLRTASNPIVGHTHCGSVLAGMPELVPYVEACLNARHTDYTDRRHSMYVLNTSPSSEKNPCILVSDPSGSVSGFVERQRCPHSELVLSHTTWDYNRAKIVSTKTVHCVVFQNAIAFLR